MAAARLSARIGGHAVADSLRALGAEVVLGLPGVHALPVWEGLRASGLRVVGFRQELNAAFAADGYARAAGRPAPLVVSTGPGALMTLGALAESCTAFVPVVVLATQIPLEGIGRGRGHLHETRDQAAAFAPLVKWQGRAESAEAIPETLAEAWRRAATPPAGPVYVELPADVLRAHAGPAPEALDGAPEALPLPDGPELDRAAGLLAGARRPLLVAGGGAVRSGAGPDLLELAERLDAPVATTYTGKGAVPEEHPLALGSAWDDPAHRRELARADVVLVVGSWLGYELWDAFAEVRGTVLQVDAAPERIGLTVPALGLVGDARAVVRALAARVPPREPGPGRERAAAVRAEVERVLAAEPNRLVASLLRQLAEALPEGGAASWDSTILAYAACWYLRVPEPRSFLYPAGSSTLGYAWPAALGASLALGGAPALAVVGDGGLQYGLAELATARQHGLPASLLVLDDGGYGILREYQEEAGYARCGVDLEHPDLAAVLAAFGLRARRTSPERLGRDVRAALARGAPAAVLLEEELRMPQPGAV